MGESGPEDAFAGRSHAVLAFGADGVVTMCEGAGLGSLCGAHLGPGDGVLAALAPEDELAQAVSRCLAGKPSDLLVTREGAIFSVRLRPMPGADGPGGLLMALDISGRQQAIQEFRRREHLYRAIVEATSEGILVLGADAVVKYVNDRGLEQFGVSAESLLGRSMFQLDRDEAMHAAMLQRLQRCLAGERLRFERQVRRRDGVVQWFLFSLSRLERDNGSPADILVMFTDISDLKRQEAELERLALRDGLTGLPNRQLLRDRLEHALSRREHGGPVALLFCDLDQFKAVNDSMGHLAGDELLRQVARRFKQALRPEDTLARLGGDEFVVLCEDVPRPQVALDVAERLGRACAEPFPLEGTQVRMSVSIGIALAEGRTAVDPQNDADCLLRDADIALYRAKERGRARSELFDDSMATAVRDKLQTLSDLRGALARDELVLHYQPVVAVTGGRVVGVEALLRWQHPRRGLLYPDEFLPVAEESGLLVELGRWVLRRALAQASAWPEDARLNVNLSVRELLHPEIEASARAALHESGFPPERLTFEVTESALMSELSAGSQSLDALRAMGARIALDDFGTGYSSFSYLSRLPLDTLKLDRSFVLDLGTTQGRAVVSGMIRLAHGLELPVVAEGVETAEQLTALCAIGCDFVQGFHLGRPVPSPDFRQSTATPPWPPAPVRSA